MNVEQTRAKIIADFNESIERLTAERTALTDAERVMYVITVSKLPMSVHGEKPTWVPLRDATRYTILSSAQQMAARLVNGLGERGEVVTLGTAYNEAIDEIVNTIHSLQSFVPGSSN